MSGHRLGASEQADTSSFNNGHHEPEHPLIILSRRFLDRGDSFIYAIVGICFFLGAIFTLGYSFWDFSSTIFNVQGLVNAVTTPQSIVAGAIIKLVSDLLLVLIDQVAARFGVLAVDEPVANRPDAAANPAARVDDGHVGAVHHQIARGGEPRVARACCCDFRGDRQRRPMAQRER